MEENVQSESKNSIWLLVVAVIVAIVITLVLWFAFRTDLPKAMLDITWEWIQLTETMPASQSVVADSENYNIMFSADDTYNAKADCNMLSGGYEATRDSLTLLPVGHRCSGSVVYVARPICEGGDVFLPVGNTVE